MLPTSPEHMNALGEILHTTGEHMIIDDAEDIGMHDYFGREGHYYHGIHQPDHPSPFHHYQIGGLLVFFGKLIGLASIAESLRQEEIKEKQEPEFFKKLF